MSVFERSLLAFAFGAEMTVGRQRKELKIRRTVSAEPMSAFDLQAAEAILARLAARAFAADHPELFGPYLEQVLNGKVSGLPSTARAETVAPAAKDGSSENEWSVEQDGDWNDRI